MTQIKAVPQSAHWIWLSPEQYPEFQLTEQRIFWPKKYKDCVAEFQKVISFSQVPKKITLYVSGDSVFRLWLNEVFVGQGPASAGGDFLIKQDEPLPWYYANQYTLQPNTTELHFHAEVRLQPQEMTDITGGHGGFYLACIAEFADGTQETFGTDGTWQVRVDKRFPAPYVYDETAESGEWQFATLTGDTRMVSVAPIPNLCYETVYPQENVQYKPYSASSLHVCYEEMFPQNQGERGHICNDVQHKSSQANFLLHTGSSVMIKFDRIYSAHLALRCDKPCHVQVACYETDGLCVSKEELNLSGKAEYRSLYMKSISLLEISVIETEDEVCVEPFLYFSHYPVEADGQLHTSDAELDLLYDVCKWTLKICRQTLHLDSPKHQELLACSGDYYIESMMTAFTFGDMRLAALDVRRTAQWLEYNHGRMFHTTYSLIWVQWLEFVFQFTGEAALLEDCHNALVSLFDCFKNYMGEKGVLENPPDYMFVDWVVLEGYSMHHPPKSLGQTVLNAFYYKALMDAALIAKRQGWQEAAQWQERANALRQAFHKCFYDEEKQMYLDGLGDPVEEKENQPANVPLKHYSRYANTLAALYDICPPEETKRLVRLVVDEQNGLPPVQPYFMHFILQAVCKADLAKEYGFVLFEKWKPLVRECAKGLQEGWIAPEPSYSFDHSHAWGGTPAYHIPFLLTGFQMVEPGFQKISLSPQLFGLEYADVSFPTSYGMLRCVQRQGEAPQIMVPEGLKWELV